MAFASIATSNTSQEDSAVSTHTVSLPSGITSGDLLLVGFGHATDTETPVFPAGWSLIVETDNAGGGTEGLAIHMRRADGTEGSTITVTTTGTTRSTHVALRISGDDTGTTPETSSAIANNAPPNPPSLTPTGGAKDYLWLAWGASSHAGTYTAFSTDYTYITPLQIANSVSGSATRSISGLCARQLNASSEDPSAWSHDQSAAEMVAITMAVHPAPTGGGFTIPLYIHRLNQGLS